MIGRKNTPYVNFIRGLPYVCKPTDIRLPNINIWRVRILLVARDIYILGSDILFIHNNNDNERQN